MQHSTAHNLILGELDSPTDVILRIRDIHMPRIISGEKNYECRDYILGKEVQRIWLYVDEDRTIQYVLTIGDVRVPGEASDPNGIGNDFSDRGLRKSRFRYPIKTVHKLPVALGIAELLNNFGVDLVTKGKQYAKRALVDRYPIETIQRIVPEENKAMEPQ